METYRLFKEAEYIRLFSNPIVNIQKLPEEERGTNFDRFLEMYWLKRMTVKQSDQQP